MDSACQYCFLGFLPRNEQLATRNNYFFVIIPTLSVQHYLSLNPPFESAGTGI